MDASVWRALRLCHWLVDAGRHGWPSLEPGLYHVSRCDDLLLSSPLLLCHPVLQVGSRFHGIVAERAVYVMFLLCFIDASLIPMLDQECIPLYILFVCLFWITHAHSLQMILVSCSGFNVFNGLNRFSWVSITFSFPHVETSSEWGRLWHLYHIKCTIQYTCTLSTMYMYCTPYYVHHTLHYIKWTYTMHYIFCSIYCALYTVPYIPYCMSRISLLVCGSAWGSLYPSTDPEWSQLLVSSVDHWVLNEWVHPQSTRKMHNIQWGHAPEGNGG